MNSESFLRYTLHLAQTDAPLSSAALDYHPAVADILKLPVAGWQDATDGSAITFWLDADREDAALAAGLAAVRRHGELEVTAEEHGWLSRWQEFHQPVTAGRLFVRPPWDPPQPELLDLIIEVGMAFGTGAHATTFACLEALDLLPRGSLLDIGTGSGVLALAALRLGFEPVFGIDNDELAVAAARRNAALNGLAAHVLAGDALDLRTALPETTVVVANLMLAPLVRLARRYHASGDGGRGGSAAAAARHPFRPQHLVLAGLLESQGEEALAAYPGFALVGRAVRDDWLLLHLAAR